MLQTKTRNSILVTGYLATAAELIWLGGLRGIVTHQLNHQCPVDSVVEFDIFQAESILLKTQEFSA